MGDIDNSSKVIVGSRLNQDSSINEPLVYQPTVEKHTEIHVETGENAPLERNLGFFSSVGVIIGCIIGSGIFISPAGVLASKLIPLYVIK